MSCVQLSIRVNRRQNWEDDDVFSSIREAFKDLPTYGSRRVWILLRRHSGETSLSVVNVKRVYRLMRGNNLLQERKPTTTVQIGAHGRFSHAIFAADFSDFTQIALNPAVALNTAAQSIRVTE